jgi:hypothetical protein
MAEDYYDRMAREYHFLEDLEERQETRDRKEYHDELEAEERRLREEEK